MQRHFSSPVNDDHLPIALRKPRRLNRIQCYRDDVAQSLPVFPPASEFEDDHPVPSNSSPLTPQALPSDAPGPPTQSPSSNSLPDTLGLSTQSSSPSTDSPRNIFGLFRRYLSKTPPLHDPEKYLSLAALSEDPPSIDNLNLVAEPRSSSSFYPYPNMSSYRLGDWFWNNGHQKSRESFTQLLDIVGASDFKPEDVRQTKWGKIDAILGSNDFDGKSAADEKEEGEWLDEDAGWSRTPITISVPFHSRSKESGPQDYHVGDLYHRSLVSVIREKLANPGDDRGFHYQPFELFWTPPNLTDEIRVHGELYASPAFLDAHQGVQELPAEPGCDLPRFVVAMMFSSDATHLTSFGTAKLWPCYLFFGNESKYNRCKPSCHLCNHVAYFQTVRLAYLCFGASHRFLQLPDAFKDFATEYAGPAGASKALTTHCRREVLHAQWSILLDDEFMEAYVHGIVIKCCDGIMRRFYPRILTYSADYPEKYAILCLTLAQSFSQIQHRIILASIRNKGQCPCPRCLIPLVRVHNLGKTRDMQQRKSLARVDDEGRRRKVESAREIIYTKNYAVDSEPVENHLKDQSLVPTVVSTTRQASFRFKTDSILQNAFSQKLSPLGFNLFPMLVVDLMHEFELGVWKAFFIHLLRILNAMGKDLVNELDRRCVHSRIERELISHFD